MTIRAEIMSCLLHAIKTKIFFPKFQLNQTYLFGKNIQTQKEGYSYSLQSCFLDPRIPEMNIV